MCQLSIPESTALQVSLERNPHSGHVTRFHLTMLLPTGPPQLISATKKQKGNQEFFLVLIVVVHAFHPSTQDAEAGGPV